MAIILSVANQKGGCGKTTTSMNLAGGLAQAGYRTLVVDADNQASACVWSVAQGQNQLPFDVMGAQLLRWNFQKLHQSQDHDVILIDCPPGVASDTETAGKHTRDAIVAADALLVPVRPSTLDFSATATFARYLLRTRRPEQQQVAVLINSRQHTVLGRDAQARAADLFADVPHASVLDTSISLRASITEVSGSGRTIFEYAAPSSPARQEYANLTQEIIEWLSLAPTSQP